MCVCGGGGEGGFGRTPAGLHGPHCGNACMQRKMRDYEETRLCMIANIEYANACTSEYKGKNSTQYTLNT